jgi:ASC-1-like (ASCH) protein
MNLRDNPFDQIKSKHKDIEIRLLDEKRQEIKVRDYILFIKKSDIEKKILTKVTNLFI